MVVLVAMGVGTIDPREVLVHAGAEESGSVARLLRSVGGNGAPQLRQFDPANNQFEFQAPTATAIKRFSLATFFILDTRQQLPHDAEGGGDNARGSTRVHALFENRDLQHNFNSRKQC